MVNVVQKALGYRAILLLRNCPGQLPKYDLLDLLNSTLTIALNQRRHAEVTIAGPIFQTKAQDFKHNN